MKNRERGAKKRIEKRARGEGGKKGHEFLGSRRMKRGRKGKDGKEREGVKVKVVRKDLKKGDFRDLDSLSLPEVTSF